MRGEIIIMDDLKKDIENFNDCLKSEGIVLTDIQLIKLYREVMIYGNDAHLYIKKEVKG